MTCRTAALAASVSLALLLVLMLIAPFMAPFGTFTGLDGSPAYVDHDWSGHGLTGIAYLIGDIACHQEMSRSIVLNGSQMPICIRDLGILAGALVGCTALPAVIDRLRGNRAFAIGVALTLMTGVEWAVEGVVGDMPVPRFASGLITGMGASMLLGWWMEKSLQPAEE